MKKRLLISGLISGIILCMPVNAQKGNETKTKLFTIGQGEKPVYSECSILLNSSGSAVSLVTIDKNSKYYMYDKGTRKGPYEDSKNIGWVSNDNADDMNTSIYYDENTINLENN